MGSHRTWPSSNAHFVMYRDRTLSICGVSYVLVNEKSVLACSFPLRAQTGKVEGIPKSVQKRPILDAGGNRSTRRKPARSGMDRQPNSLTNRVRSGERWVICSLHQPDLPTMSIHMQKWDSEYLSLFILELFWMFVPVKFIQILAWEKNKTKKQ